MEKSIENQLVPINSETFLNLLKESESAIDNKIIVDDIHVNIQREEDIVLKNMIFEGGLIFGEEFGTTITFDNCEIRKGVTFKSCKSFEKLVFNKTKIENGINLNQLGISSEVRFDDSKFDFVNIANLKTNQVEFKKCEISDKLTIAGGDFQSLLIENSKIGICQISGKVTIRASIKTTKSNFIEFSIEFDQGDLEFINKIELDNVTSEFLFISNFETNELSINNLRISGGKVVHLNQITCNSLKLSNLQNFGSLFLQNLFGSKNILNIAEESKRQIEGEKKAALKITNSFLGNTTFTRCNFDQFDEIIISDSDLSQISFIGTQNFNPKKITVLPYNNAGKREIAVEKRLLYGQLKKAFNTRGDRVEAIQYYALEMLEYKKSLPYGFRRLPEHILLWVNNISTGFDRWWMQGILMTLLSSFFCMYMYCLSLKFGDIQSTNDLFYNNWFKVFEFMLPTHSWSFLTTECNCVPNGWSYFVDALSRIINSYLIYQTIQAFRKFGKN